MAIALESALFRQRTVTSRRVYRRRPRTQQKET
jgi:hypothetical protein